MAQLGGIDTRKTYVNRLVALQSALLRRKPAADISCIIASTHETAKPEVTCEPATGGMVETEVVTVANRRNEAGESAPAGVECGGEGKGGGVMAEVIAAETVGCYREGRDCKDEEGCLGGSEG